MDMADFQIYLKSIESKKGKYPALQQNFDLVLEEGTIPLRVQTIVTDLTSGRQVKINMLNSKI